MKQMARILALQNAVSHSGSEGQLQLGSRQLSSSSLDSGDSPTRATRQAQALNRLSPLGPAIDHNADHGASTAQRLRHIHQNSIDLQPHDTNTSALSAYPTSLFSIENNEKIRTAAETLNEAISKGDAPTDKWDMKTAEDTINSARTLMTTLAPDLSSAVGDRGGDITPDEYRATLNRILADAGTGLTAEELAPVLLRLWTTPPEALGKATNNAELRKDIIVALSLIEPIAVKGLEMFERWGKAGPEEHKALNAVSEQIAEILKQHGIHDAEQYLLSLENPGSKETGKRAAMSGANVSRRQLRDAPSSPADAHAPLSADASTAPASGDASESSASSDTEEADKTKRHWSSAQWGAAMARWTLAGTVALKNAHLNHIKAASANADAKYHAAAAAGAATMVQFTQAAASPAEELQTDAKYLDETVKLYKKAVKSASDTISLGAGGSSHAVLVAAIHANNTALTLAKEAHGTMTAINAYQAERRATHNSAETAMIASIVAQTLNEEHYGQLRKAKTFPKPEDVLDAFARKIADINEEIKKKAGEENSGTPTLIHFTDEQIKNYSDAATNAFYALVAEFHQDTAPARDTSSRHVTESHRHQTMTDTLEHLTEQEALTIQLTSASFLQSSLSASEPDAPGNVILNLQPSAALRSTASSTTSGTANLPDLVESEAIAAAASVNPPATSGEAEIVPAVPNPVADAPAASAENYARSGLVLGEPSKNEVLTALRELGKLAASANDRAKETQRRLANAAEELESAAGKTTEGANNMLVQSNTLKQRISNLPPTRSKDNPAEVSLQNAVTKARQNPPSATSGGSAAKRLDMLDMLEDVCRSIWNPKGTASPDNLLQNRLTEFKTLAESMHATASQANEALKTKNGEAQKCLDDKITQSNQDKKICGIVSGAEWFSPALVGFSAAVRSCRLDLNGRHPLLGDNATLAVSLAGDVLTAIEFFNAKFGPFAKQRTDAHDKTHPSRAPGMHVFEDPPLISIQKGLSGVASVGGAIGNLIYAGSNSIGGSLALTRGSPFVGGIAIGTALVDGSNALTQLAKNGMTQNKEGGGWDSAREFAQNYANYAGGFSRFVAATLALGAILANETKG